MFDANLVYPKKGWAGQLDTDSPAERRSTLRYCRVGGSLAGQLVSYRMPSYNRDFRPGHWIIVVVDAEVDSFKW